MEHLFHLSGLVSNCWIRGWRDGPGCWELSLSCFDMFTHDVRSWGKNVVLGHDMSVFNSLSETVFIDLQIKRSCKRIIIPCVQFALWLHDISIYSIASTFTFFKKISFIWHVCYLEDWFQISSTVEWGFKFCSRQCCSTASSNRPKEYSPDCGIIMCDAVCLMK